MSQPPEAVQLNRDMTQLVLDLFRRIKTSRGVLNPAQIHASLVFFLIAHANAAGYAKEEFLEALPDELRANWDHISEDFQLFKARRRGES